MPKVGVSLSSINSQIAKSYGLSADEGAYVASVANGSGAQEAGIQEGDIIITFDGETVEGASVLMLAVRGKNPCDTVTLTVNSEGQDREVHVTLGDDAASQQAAASPRQRPG